MVRVARSPNRILEQGLDAQQEAAVSQASGFTRVETEGPERDGRGEERGMWPRS